MERADGKVWYIPHHRVFHPKKGLLRVVFDCEQILKESLLIVNCCKALTLLIP